MWRRKPAVAGSFYPSDPRKLSREIERYLEAAGEKPLQGKLVSLVVPHAGYVYSGPVAAFSYKHLIGSGVEVAVVLAPSHRARFNGASVIPSGIYETPLGDVPIDETIGARLVEKPHLRFIREAHEAEHSLEVQVPFLQVVLPGLSLVPIIIGTTDMDICASIAGEISEVLLSEKRKIAVIISTDLSHYHSYEKARSLDGVFIKLLESYDAGKLRSALAGDETQACGEGPVLCGMFLSKSLGADRVEILKYANSGDTAGGRDQVVGYLSAAMTARE